MAQPVNSVSAFTVASPNCCGFLHATKAAPLREVDTEAWGLLSQSATPVCTGFLTHHM